MMHFEDKLANSDSTNQLANKQGNIHNSTKLYLVLKRFNSACVFKYCVATAIVNVVDMAQGADRPTFLTIGSGVSNSISNINPEQIASDLFNRAKSFFNEIKAKIS
jgi:hypothetical protein